MHAVKRFQDAADKAAKDAEEASVGSGSTLATGRRYRRPKSRGWSPEGRSPVGSPQAGNGGMGLGMLVGVAHEVEIGAVKEKEEEWAEEVPKGAAPTTDRQTPTANRRLPTAEHRPLTADHPISIRTLSSSHHAQAERHEREKERVELIKSGEPTPKTTAGTDAGWDDETRMGTGTGTATRAELVGRFERPLKHSKI